MKKLFNCRRSLISILGMLLLTWLGLHNGTDVSLAIAGIVAAVAGANSYQRTVEARSYNMPKDADGDVRGGQ